MKLELFGSFEFEVRCSLMDFHCEDSLITIDVMCSAPQSMNMSILVMEVNRIKFVFNCSKRYLFYMLLYYILLYCIILYYIIF